MDNDRRREKIITNYDEKINKEQETPNKEH